MLGGSGGFLWFGIVWVYVLFFDVLKKKKNTVLQDSLSISVVFFFLFARVFAFLRRLQHV